MPPPLRQADRAAAFGNAARVAAADFDGDGLVDFVTVGQSGGGGAGGGAKLIVSFQKAGTFKASPAVAAPGNDFLATGDFDGDGKADVALAPHGALGPDGLTVLWSIGDGTFTPGPTVGGAFIDAATADFDGDGRADIALDGFPNLGLYSADKQGNVKPLGTTQVPSAAIDSVAVGDVTGDLRSDVVVWVGPCPGGGPCTGSVLTVSLDGSGNRVSPLDQAKIVPPDFPKLRLGDVDADGKLDVVLLFDTATVQRLVVLKGNGDGTFGPP